MERARALGYRYVGKPVDNAVVSAYNKDVANFKVAIASGAQPLSILKGPQEKHILGSPNYIPGRSYLYGSVADAQKLVDRYAGTGRFEPNGKGAFTKKEVVKADRIIGVVVDSMGIHVETTMFKIHYRKTGAHIVPKKEV